MKLDNKNGLCMHMRIAHFVKELRGALQGNTIIMSNRDRNDLQCSTKNIDMCWGIIRKVELIPLEPKQENTQQQGPRQNHYS